MSLWPHLCAACAMHPEPRRPASADYVAIVEELGVLLVADGSRGGAHGDVAAKISVDAVRDLFTQPDTTWPDDAADEPIEARARMLAAFSLANRRVRSRARRHAYLAGMSSSLAAALVLPAAASVCFARVGNACVLLMRERRLTRPSGEASPEALTRGIGLSDAVEPDVRIVDLRAGDMLLVTTASLTGVLRDAEIVDLLNEPLNLGEMVKALVDRARERGSLDAITTVLARWSP